MLGVEIPKNIKTLNSKFIANDNNTILIPYEIKEIDECAFSNCSSLTSITIPNSVTQIGDDTFYDCESLTSITIPENLRNSFPYQKNA